MLIADLHIHSKYSRATSRECDLPHLDFWARRKGIGLVGTGDFTHPAWREEMARQLEPAEQGLYRLRQPFRLPGLEGEPRFVVSGEISSIYKRGGRVRKVHNVILLPGLEEADELSRRLEAIGNIRSDGRPILGLDSRDLLEITLECCPQALFIPAHIWTPHFSLFGAFSGFDTLEECFGDLTGCIHAVETGLSSDPPMNWRVPQLDGLQLLSHSDAHSPARLGRECNLLDIELSYDGLARAVNTGEGLAGTIEFFPEEGKYHLDGHRACGVCLEPEETARLEGRCPVCGRKLTIGVQHRVEQLARRPEGARCGGAKPFESLAPLPEVIAASTGASPTGGPTTRLYEHMLRTLGPEFAILRERDPADIEREAGPCVAEGIRRLRRGEVRRQAGFDGQYGVIGLLDESEIRELSGQASLFGAAEPLPRRKRQAGGRVLAPARAEETAPAPAFAPNEGQKAAIETGEGIVAVIAGPGTGKTGTLVERIAYLIEHAGARPAEITAVTFTRQAADEVRCRLESRLGKKAVRGLTAGTFHAVSRQILGDAPLLGDAEALELARRAIAETGWKGTPRRLLQEVSRVKNGLPGAGGALDDACGHYCALARQSDRLDFDDLLAAALEAEEKRKPFTHLLVDEFQDVNDLQYRLVRKWAAGSRSLFVIGDPDQAIYRFRGAVGDSFARLQSDEPSAKVIRLGDNYRSTPEILGCALPVVGGRDIRAVRPGGAPVRLVQAGSDFAEGVFVAKEIARMTGGVDMLESQRAGAREGTRSFSDIAVLCRTHRQAALLEKCLRHDDIPAVIIGRQDFLQQDSVRGAVGFLRWMLDPGDAEGLRLALKNIWHCPADLVERGAAAAALNIQGRRESCAGLPLLEQWLDETERTAPHLTGKPHKLLDGWAERYGPDENLQKLADMAVFYDALGPFLDDIASGQEGDLRRAASRKYASGAVRLMTLHGAKGLEFPVAFVTGVRAGSIPPQGADGEDENEERRLLYVGLTRARDELVITAGGELSPLLGDLPQGVRRERAPQVGRSDEGEQLRLF